MTERRRGATVKHLARGAGLVVILLTTAGAACWGSRESWEYPPRVAEVAAGTIIYPKAEWARLANPAVAGWDLKKLEQALEIWRGNRGTSAVMVVHRGAVVASWGPVERPMVVRSIRKSLLSSLVGIHLEAGRLALDRTLEQMQIDDDTPLTPAEKQARLGDLLTSRSGVYLPAAKETSQNRDRRPPRGSHAAGSFYYYNNWDFNVLGTILNQETGQDLFRDFRMRIARPIGMQDFHIADQKYEREKVSRHPAYWFDLSARDLARFGLLYLSGGEWEGKQVVPSDWVRASTSSLVPDAKGGADYGYLWWRRPASVEQPAGGDYFYADGSGFMWVVPRKELVVVHLIETWPARGLLHVLRMLPDEDRVWEIFETVMAAAPEP